jgi:hypothetical protein
VFDVSTIELCPSRFCTTYGPKDGVRWLYGVWGGDPVAMAVDASGILWIGGRTPPATGPGIRTDGCGGLLSFDGKRWKPYLSTRCVIDIAVHPNRSIWVMTEEAAEDPVERYPHHLYVITP